MQAKERLLSIPLLISIFRTANLSLLLVQLGSLTAALHGKTTSQQQSRNVNSSPRLSCTHALGGGRRRSSARLEGA